LKFTKKSKKKATPRQNQNQNKKIMKKKQKRAIRRVLSSEPSRQNDVLRKTPKTNKD